MFEWNHNGKRDTGDSFMDFMVFHQVMDAGKKNRQKQKKEPKRSWIDQLEEQDAMDDEED